MDAEHWGDPTVFRPERFLDHNGQIINDPWFMPFGIGTYNVVYLFLNYLNSIFCDRKKKVPW